MELATVRDSLREQIENRRQEIHDNRAKLALSINSFYESFFPTVGDAGRYLLAHFDAAAGCLVCGSRDQKAIERVSSKLYMNTCPICESKIEDPHGPTTDPHAGELIEALRATIAKAESDVEAMQTPLRDAEKEYADVAAKLVGISSSLAQLDQQLMALGQSVPNAVQRRNELQERLLTFEAALNEIEVERLALAEQFRELAHAIDRDVLAVSAEIESRFAKYIQGFLAERCDIKYTPRQKRIGQRTVTESFPFPHFVPALTSGVQRDSTTIREAGQSVSESQKEFIDLAFRMALLDLSAPNASVMLVLETPEASLDSVFIPRAGDLLRRFARREGDVVGTRLIASSNVNRELMIPALFGAYPDSDFYGQVTDEPDQETLGPVPIEERSAHILDLLSIAAPTRALERFREAYEHERDAAIFPERYKQVDQYEQQRG